LAANWYVNEGETGVVIPCEMEIELDKSDGNYEKVEWIFQRLHFRTSEPVGSPVTLIERRYTDTYHPTATLYYSITKNNGLSINREVVSEDIGQYMCHVIGKRESYKST